MALPNTQKINVEKSQAIKADWYEAILIGHVEKDNNDITSSHIEFELAQSMKHIWAVLTHDEENLHRIKRLKQALEMDDNESDLGAHYKKHLMVFVDNDYKDGKVVNVIRDFDKYVPPAAAVVAEKKAAPKPVKKAEPAAAPPQIEPEEHGRHIPKLILIVDDQPEVATLVGNYVEQIGFVPDIVADVDEALARYDPDKYLMVISDVIMPGKNGFDLVRGLHNKYPNVFVALISGYFDKEMENLQKLFGIEKVYRKPVFFNSVKEMVASALQKVSKA